MESTSADNGISQQDAQITNQHRLKTYLFVLSLETVVYLELLSPLL